MTYGPRLTNKMKRALQAEIEAFNKAKTLRELEANSIGHPNTDAYQTWLENQPERHNMPQPYETLEANPDQLSETQAFKWGKSSNLTPDEEIKRAQIQKILTPKQWAVWKLCMQHAVTQQVAAKQLNITQATLAIHLKRAIQIVTQYFTNGNQ